MRPGLFDFSDQLYDSVKDMRSSLIPSEGKLYIGQQSKSQQEMSHEHQQVDNSVSRGSPEEPLGFEESGI